MKFVLSKESINFALLTQQPFALVLLFIILFLCGGITQAEAKRKQSPASAVKQVHKDFEKLSSSELMGLLMAFSDTYMEQVREAADDILDDQSLKPSIRLYVERIKPHYSMGAITNACQINPQSGLLDMVTMVTLQRLVWEDPAVHKYVGANNSKIFVAALKNLEQDVWKIAARIFNAEQISSLHTLIQKWRDAHPRDQYVTFIKFQDFAASGMKDRLAKVISSGLLSPISDVNHEIHESRMLGERAMFLFKRMPMLMQWHGTLVGTEVLANPEFQDFIKNFGLGVEAVDRVGNILEQMPVFLKQIAEFDQITKQANEAALNLRLMFEIFERISAPDEFAVPGDLSGLDKVNKGIESLAVVTKDLNPLLTKLDMLLAKTGDIGEKQIIEDVDEMFSNQIYLITFCIAGLMVLAFILGVGLIFAARRKN